MKKEDCFKEHQLLISKLAKKGFKDKRGNALSEDNDFIKLCSDFRDAKNAKVSNYNAYAELKEKFKPLAVAFCMEADISNILD